MATDRSYIGKPQLRIEDQALLTGKGRFTANLHAQGELQACFVRSPHAHARIVAIDTAEACASPGVVAVYTHADLARDGIGALPHVATLKRPDGTPMSAPPRHALADGVARHVGEALAVVIAESTWQAMDAAELVAVDYEALDAVTSVVQAVREDAVQVWPQAPGNVVSETRYGDEQRVDEAMKSAAHVTRVELVSNRVVVAAIEPRAALAEYDADSDRLTLHVQSQDPRLLRQHLAVDVLRVDPARVRVVVGDIGGAFGMKSFLYPEYVAVAFAARKLRRPVRWVSTRSEAFVTDTHGRDHVTVAELALGIDHRFTALRVRTLANMGAYLSHRAAVIPSNAGPRVLTGVYKIAEVDARISTVLTHTTPIEAYRGAGRPEVIYQLERLVDAAAAELGMDPAELRRRNMVRAADMPYRNALGHVYDSGDFALTQQMALDAFDWKGFETRRASASRRGKLAGRGLAYYIEWTGGITLEEWVSVCATGDGRIVVTSGTQAMGQGIATAYAQIAAHTLGLDIALVAIVQGDTDLVLAGAGSAASRSLFVGGSAVQAGAQALVERGRELAAQRLGVEPGEVRYGRGVFSVEAGRSSLTIFELAAGQRDGLLRVETRHAVHGPSWPNGCHACEVEIDPETGHIDISRYVVADDVGVAVNPMLVEGQIHGGVAQGIGQAMYESCVYDAGSGQLLTGSFLDYALPRAADLPSIDLLENRSTPCTTNPLGAKGAGEAGTVGAPPALVSAVLDALRVRGIAHIDMPMTSERVWRAANGLPS